MSGSRVYGAAGEEDLPSIVRLMQHAFAASPDVEEKWIRPTGLQHFRVAREREGAPAAACLLRVPMGQRFGGRAVSMLGIAGVAVAPEQRGQGMARWMMGSAMQEAHEDGFGLSTLYASTQGLYRQVGYEQAGYRCVTKLLAHRIDVRDREPAVRPLTAHDDQAMAACYGAYAGRFAGTLERGPYIWRRVRELRGTKYHAFGVDAPNVGGGKQGALEGYVFLSQNRVGDGIELDVSDLAFTTARAGRRLLGFLADFSTTTKEISIAGAPLHPAISLLTSHHHTIAKSEVWMTRITDLARALTERGYPRNLSATIRLNIHDPIVRSNDGNWTLRVEHGRAEVKKEAAVRPALTCEIGKFTAIYSGLYTASQGALLGWVEGEAGALEAADGVFGGFGTPWMSDFF